MMKLVYRVKVVTLLVLAFAFAVAAQTPRVSTTTTTNTNARSDKDPRNQAPTVGTGGSIGGPTGLFTVYDGETLRKGEYTFSAAYSNYDRDPGNVDIVETPVSFQIGITNRLEAFFTTDAYRAVKVNSPGNLSSFYLPNSRINGISPGAIILAPGTGGAFSNRAVYRPIGTQPFVQYPFTGGSAGTFGLQAPFFFSGPLFGFPAGTSALLGPPRDGGGSGADLYPGVGSVYGGILPGIVLQTACSQTGATTCVPAATVPTVFTTAPSYLPDAPFINRTYGESSFNSFNAGIKWRWTGIRNPIGVGLVAYYRWYADRAGDFSGFNQLQRGSSPGGNRGDINVTLFAGARLARWANLSANLGYQYNSSVKADGFTLLDRGDELQAAIGVDFPVNRYIQPIFEIRSLKYVGGRTPNAFENDPIDALAGIRIFPARWFGFGAAYRYHANEQDTESFNQDDTFNTAFAIPCLPGQTACTPRVINTSFSGVPPGFQVSSDPHGYIIQGWIGRRNKRQGEVINQAANVTALTVSDTTITLPCRPGYVPRSGTACADNQTVSVTTTAVDPENDILTYNYTVSSGRIVGTGANVQWDLSGLAPGTYTITAGVDDGCGLCGKTETRTITIAECDCVIACTCPTVSVQGPAGIANPGDTMTFTASVVGGSQQSVTYNWTVSDGTIESGQGTPSITVRVPTNTSGGNITATVDVGGTECSCTGLTQSATGSYGGKPEAVKINEFGQLPNDQIRAQLDIFFQELQNNPSDQGYIINYGTDREIAARERLITNHIAFRKFDRSRITLVRGGASPSGGPYTKLYRIPPGAENPAP
jgi:hypothetical protein